MGPGQNVAESEQELVANTKTLLLSTQNTVKGLSAARIPTGDLVKAITKTAVDISQVMFPSKAHGNADTPSFRSPGSSPGSSPHAGPPVGNMHR